MQSFKQIKFRSLVAKIQVMSLLIVGIAVVPTLSNASVAGITDCKFGRAQIWDTKWGITGGYLNASGFQNIYAGSTKPAEAVGWTPLNNLDFAEGDYFQFFESTVYPGQLGIKQFTSGGNLKWVVNEGGLFRAMGDDFIFFNYENMNGTIITTGSGYAADGSVSLAVIEENPSVEVMASYTSRPQPFWPPEKLVAGQQWRG